MIEPGEVYYADTDAGRRPVIVLSREELNRGNWVVVVPITSTRFVVRSRLPHCVPFQAGEFGLSKDCVAQAELVGAILAARLDVQTGPIGMLDEVRMRDLIKAVGDMMGSDCEPV
jgi:mRNA-degrading endonuclease toxin of MazEF toxin-antitoxin module